MGKLEKRFFNNKRETVIKSNDENSDIFHNFLKKALGKSNWIARGGRPSKYYFSFDKIYNQVSPEEKQDS